MSRFDPVTEEQAKALQRLSYEAYTKGRYLHGIPEMVLVGNAYMGMAQRIWAILDDGPIHAIPDDPKGFNDEAQRLADDRYLTDAERRDLDYLLGRDDLPPARPIVDTQLPVTTEALDALPRRSGPGYTKALEDTVSRLVAERLDDEGPC